MRYSVSKLTAYTYISEGIHFSLLIRRTTVNKILKYPGKQNPFEINSEIIISRMFVQWIVVPNYELQINYAEYCPSIGGHGSGVDPAGFCICFWSRESSISEKTDPEPESVSFFAVTRLCMVFTNAIASVQNKRC